MRQMCKKAKKVLHTVFSVILSLLVVAVGSLFIIGCIGIYSSGDRPFTRESVGAALKLLAAPAVILTVMAFLGAILSFVLPLEEKKKPDKNPRFTRIRLAKLCDERRLASGEKEEIRREKTVRAFILFGAVMLLCCSLIYPLTYIFTKDRFGAQGPDAINTEFIRALSVLGVCLIPSALYTIIGIFAIRKSYQREIEVLKSYAARCAADKKSSAIQSTLSDAVIDENTDVIVKKVTPVSKKLIFSLQIIILCVAVAFILLGIKNGGMADVYEKARKICTECIGLG